MKMLHKVALVALICALPVLGHDDTTAGMGVFVAPMSNASETTPVSMNASGTAVITANVLRDTTGQIVSGSVEFRIIYTFPSAVTFTGLHIHRGGSGVAGPVVINSGIPNPTPSAESGRGTALYTGDVLDTNTAGVQALRDLFTSPGDFYVNIHTTDFPGGVMRGQLRRAQVTTLMGNMSSAKEVPPVSVEASGRGTIVAVRAFDPDGRFAAGAVTFDAEYALPAVSTLSGFHIHRGDATVAGPVTINTGLTAATAPEPAASGRLQYTVEVLDTPSTANAFTTLNGLFDDPAGYYLNLHTTANPGGVIRSQLTKAEWVRLPVSMSPDNEVPPIADLDAAAVGFVDVYALRGQSGLTVGRLTFNVNYRFPGETTFTGFHIHNGPAGENGGVVLNTGIAAGDRSVASGNGFGNITRTFYATGNALTALNGMMENPENYYINLHTTVNGGGAVRAQMAGANTAMPSVVAVISAVSNPQLRTGAPGGLMTVFGSNFSKIPSPVSGLDTPKLPVKVNGTEVVIEGRAAPIMALGHEPGFNPADYIVVQVPVETTPGAKVLVVKTSNGSSSNAEAQVATVAPGLYFDANGAVAAKLPAFTVIGPQNPAQAGDMIAILGTGFGQTTPPLETGEIADEDEVYATPTVTATVGGVAAPVISSAAVPGYAGVNFVVLQIPQGITAGQAAVVVRSGETASNSTTIPIR